MGNSVNKRQWSSWAAAFLLAIPSVGLATPGVMNYQAKFTDSLGQPINSPATIAFTFWDASSGGTQLGSGFSDTDIVAPGPNGVFSTEIGDDPGNPIPSSVFAGSSVWISVNVNGQDILPRTHVTATGLALNALQLYSESYVLVEVVPDPVGNGNNLMAAYNRAKVLKPNSEDLSTTNRATVLVPPAQYDMTTKSLLMNHEYVDLVGISTARADQHIYGTTNGPSSAVISKSANDVRISNLTIECTRTTGTLANNLGDPAAYYPGLSNAGTEIRNCEFRATDETHARSMQYNTKYLGTYVDCVGGKYAFGAGGTGMAAGTFTNCAGGDYAFGGGSGGVASGKFVNCTGTLASFGGSGGTASGEFYNCRGGIGSFAGLGGTADGTFKDCVGDNQSFGGGGIASGQFINCSGNDLSFGGDGQTSGTFLNCVGKDYSFGGYSGFPVFGTVTGSFINCIGGNASFGAGYYAFFTPTVSATFIHCTGGNFSFALDSNAPGSKFHYCDGGTNSFGGSGGPTYLYCVRNNAAYP